MAAKATKRVIGRGGPEVMKRVIKLVAPKPNVKVGSLGTGGGVRASKRKRKRKKI